MPTLLMILACLQFADYRFVNLQFIDSFCASIILTASHKQLRGVLGAEPPVLAFSLRVLGLVSQEYDVLVFSL